MPSPFLRSTSMSMNSVFQTLNMGVGRMMKKIPFISGSRLPDAKHTALKAQPSQGPNSLAPGVDTYELLQSEGSSEGIAESFSLPSVFADQIQVNPNVQQSKSNTRRLYNAGQVLSQIASFTIKDQDDRLAVFDTEVVLLVAFAYLEAEL